MRGLVLGAWGCRSPLLEKEDFPYDGGYFENVGLKKQWHRLFRLRNWVAGFCAQTGL
jgi:hypothetical protein